MHGRRSTRRLFTALAAAAVIAAAFTFGSATAGASDATSHLSGGGTAVVSGVAFSQVAFNVTINGSGSASGSFECLMAGRSSSVLEQFGLSHIMDVHATPTLGSVSWPVVSFSGPGRLTMDGGQHVGIDVTVWANVLTQQFELTVGGVPPMPPESFMSGGISLR